MTDSDDDDVKLQVHYTFRLNFRMEKLEENFCAENLVTHGHCKHPHWNVFSIRMFAIFSSSSSLFYLESFPVSFFFWIYSFCPGKLSIKS